MQTSLGSKVPQIPWYITQPGSHRIRRALTPVFRPLPAALMMSALQFMPPVLVSAHAYIDTAPQGFRFRNGITGESHATTIPPCSPGGVYTQQYQGEYQNLLPSSKTQYDNNLGNQIGYCTGGLSDSEYVYVDHFCPDGVVRFHVNNTYYACRYFEDCPEGQSRNTVTGHCEISLKNRSATDCGISTTHPVNVGTGSKWLVERDRVAERTRGLDFSRYYDYYRPGGDFDSPMGVNWRHSYQRRLELDVSSTLSLKARRADGKVYRFTYSRVYWRPDGSGYDYGEARWLPEDDIEDRLVRLSAGHAVSKGWQYTSANNVTELYDADGRLVSMTSLDGYTRTLAYDANGRLQRVDTNSGEFLVFAYVASGRISGVTDHAGRTWGYGYDSAGNLAYVNNPDLTTRRYHYNEQTLTNNTNLAHALTGITDERALSDQPHLRYATFGYDDAGRAVLSTLAGNIERVDIGYGSAGSRSLSNSNGMISAYRTDFNLGLARLKEVSASGCSACRVQGDATFEYDDFNHLIGRSENGRQTRFGNHDSKGQRGCKVEGISIADTTPNSGDCAFDPMASPQARRIDYTYDSRFYNRISSISEPSVNPVGSKLTRYSYDEFGNRTSETVSGFAPDGQGGFVPVSLNSSWQYAGPLNQLSFMDGPRTDVNDFSYYRYYPNDSTEGNNRGRLKEIEDASGVRIRSDIQYSATGKVLSESRPNGLTLSYTYYPGNDRLRTLTEFNGTGSRVTKWTYLATGEVETLTTGFGAAAASTLSFGYDAARRLTRITDGVGNYIEYLLDREGNRQAENARDSGGVLKKQLSQTFDLYNRLAGSSQANEAVNYEFAPDGTLDLQTDGNNVVTDYSYDALRRLTRVTQDLGGTDPSTANATTLYGYDVQDRLISVTDPINATTSYTYDDLGNLVVRNSPDSGTTRFEYDTAGNLIEKTDANGQVFSYHYDALNRLTAIDVIAGSEDAITYEYDVCKNGAGRLCRVTQNGVTAEYAYNAFGDVTAHQGVGYRYDAAGRLSGMTYPSGAVVSYSYDGAGQVSQVELSAGGSSQLLASGIEYEPFGRVNKLSYGNGLALIQSWDTAYRLTDAAVGSAFSLSGAHYDAVGNLLRRNDGGALNNWEYDALSRLDAASGLFGDRDYDYDANGNRTQLIIGGEITDYAYEAASNRLESETGWTYTRDANGNTIERLASDGSGRRYGYDSYNRLIMATDRWIKVQGKGRKKTEMLIDTWIAGYGYNGLGQRVTKEVGGALTQYVYGTQGELLAELDADGEVQKEYVYLNGQLLVVVATTKAIPAIAGAELIVDNGEPGTSSVGSWTATTDRKDKQTGADYLVADGGTGSLYRWTTAVSKGRYEVFAWWVRERKATSDVPFTVMHNGGASTVTVDQSQSGAQWVSLGVFDFAGIGNEYVEVSDTNGRTVADAVRLVEQVDLMPQVSVDFYYVHNDQLGTPRAMTNANGMVVWKADYAPFGEVSVDGDTHENGTEVTLNVRFPGQYYDQETGLHYNYFRYYDPRTGRYLTSDPILLDAGKNSFAYVDGNTNKNADPLGLFKVTLSFGGGIFTGEFGGTAESGIGFDDTGTICLVLTNCDNKGTIGPGFVGLGGAVGVEKGRFCEGRNLSSSDSGILDLGVGGIGSVAVVTNHNGNPIGGGKGFAGVGAALGIVTLGCETHTFCKNPFK